MDAIPLAHVDNEHRTFILITAAEHIMTQTLTTLIKEMRFA